MAEMIEISYSANPRGQVGVRPRKVKLKGAFHVFTKDPGVLSIEFIDSSPLKNGAMTAAGNKDLTVEKAGRFLFKCILNQNGTKLVLDPRDPNDPSGGGELEVEGERVG